MNWEIQHALSQGRECVCHIFAFQKLLKKGLLGVDLEKAHDTMNRTELWNSMHDYAAEDCDASDGSKAGVRIHEGKVKGCEVCKQHKTVVGFLQKEISLKKAAVICEMVCGFILIEPFLKLQITEMSIRYLQQHNFFALLKWLQQLVIFWSPFCVLLYSLDLA